MPWRTRSRIFSLAAALGWLAIVSVPPCQADLCLDVYRSALESLLRRDLRGAKRQLAKAVETAGHPKCHSCARMVLLTVTHGEQGVHKGFVGHALRALENPSLPSRERTAWEGLAERSFSELERLVGESRLRCREILGLSERYAYCDVPAEELSQLMLKLISEYSSDQEALFALQ